MKSLMNLLWRGEEGQDLVEYGLLLVLIALVATSTMSSVGSAISNVFSNATVSLTSS